MAVTQRLSANALTQEKWPETTFHFQLKNMPFSRWIGTEDSGMPIVINSDLDRNSIGDKITFELDMPLTSAGGSDDSDMEGAEEAMSSYNFPVTIHERSHAVRSAGKMTDKRTAFKILKRGFKALATWSAEQAENDIMYAICGLGNQGGYVGEGATSIATVNEHAPSTNRIVYGGQTAAMVATWVDNDNEIGDGDATDAEDYLFGTRVIEKMRYMANDAVPKLQPVMYEGKGYYILLIHPLQHMALRQETGTGNWTTVQSQANVRGPNNPIFGKKGSGRERMFDGLVGIWDDVLVFVADRLPTRISGEVFHDSTDTVHTYIASGSYRIARAVLMGAQACCWAWGQHWQRHTKGFDYNRKQGVGMDALYGVSKTVWRDPGLNQSANDEQEDFGVIVADTAVIEI